MRGCHGHDKVAPQHHERTVNAGDKDSEKRPAVRYGKTQHHGSHPISRRGGCVNPWLPPPTKLVFLRLFVVEIEHCVDGFTHWGSSHSVEEAESNVRRTL